MKSRFGYDDALDVVGVHAVGGIWGALATGLFASVLVNAPAPTASSTEIRASYSSRRRQSAQRWRFRSSAARFC